MSARTEQSSSKPESVVVASVALEMKAGIVALAGQRLPEDNAKSLIARAARRAGITYRLAKAFYYGESENPCSRGVERVRAALRAQEAKARDEYRSLRDRIAFLERRLDALDPDGTGEMAASVLGPASRSGRDRGPLDR